VKIAATSRVDLPADCRDQGGTMSVARSRGGGAAFAFTVPIAR
jgi:hypothetical protein